jgi:hypothetical protein
MAVMLHVLVQEAADQDGCHQAHRRVHEEDLTPAHGRRDDAADGRANHCGGPPHA